MLLAYLSNLTTLMLEGNSKRLGVREALVNRLGVVPEKLGVLPDHTVATLREVAALLGA